MSIESLPRRELLKTAGCGFGYLALAGLCRDTAAAKTPKNPLAAKPTHHRARAKRVIFLFMQGGPSQVDTFDYKQLLEKEDGKNLKFDNARTRKRQDERVFKSLWSFKKYGQCGQMVSDLFPHQAKLVDDFCLIHSMHTEGVAHGPATLFLHTGATQLIRPSMGAWVMYGLGTESENLPGFVTISPPQTKGGPRNYGAAFLPAHYQGTAIGRVGVPASEIKLRHLTNLNLTPAKRRQQLELLQAINRQQASSTPDDDELEATIASFELAYRMQMHAPQALDISKESKETLSMYGVGEKDTDAYGRQCLMARKLAESGVRYIQINYADHGATPKWDQHSNMPQHAVHARNTDKPVAGLLADLKQRGLLEDTLVWWGGEFGRTPFAQGKNGRDHNPKGFTVWLAGAGIRSGMAYGTTDEFGHEAAENPVHMHDLHATILHLLGLDHKRLTYRYAGRDFRLTDVHGRVVHDILS